MALSVENWKGCATPCTQLLSGSPNLLWDPHLSACHSEANTWETSWWEENRAYSRARTVRRWEWGAIIEGKVHLVELRHTKGLLQEGKRCGGTIGRKATFWAGVFTIQGECVFPWPEDRNRPWPPEPSSCECLGKHPPFLQVRHHLTHSDVIQRPLCYRGFCQSKETFFNS